MSQKSFGDITLAEYQRIVGEAAPTGAVPTGPAGPSKRFLWLRRVGLLAGALVAALFCSAVGDYLGPWSGKSASDLSYDQALEIVQQQGPERWVTEIGITVLYEHVLTAMNELHAAALANPDDSERYVGASLAQIGISAIKKLTELRQVGQENPARYERLLETLRARLPSK